MSLSQPKEALIISFCFAKQVISTQVLNGRWLLHLWSHVISKSQHWVTCCSMRVELLTRHLWPIDRKQTRPFAHIWAPALEGHIFIECLRDENQCGPPSNAIILFNESCSYTSWLKSFPYLSLRLASYWYDRLTYRVCDSSNSFL